MYVVPDTIEGHANASDVGHHLVPCWYLRTMLAWVPCQSEWSGLLAGAKPRLLLRTVSGCVVLPQPDSALVSVAHGTNKHHPYAQGMDSYLRPC